MKKYLLKYLLVALGLTFNLTLNVSPAFADVVPEHRMKAASDEYLKNHFMNGVYMFVEGDDVAAKGANGVHCLEPKENLGADQQMPVASATKTMTAAGILKLQERGLLNVQDSVAKHLNEKSGIWEDNKVPAWADKVTIHDMLTHRSGLPEYFMGAQLNVNMSIEGINKQIANFAASKELAFTPGEKHDYNNTNYVMLGLILENVSQQKAADFFEKEFFIPLEMKDTKMLGLQDALQHQREPESMKFPFRYFVTPTGAEPQFNLARHPFTMTPFTDGGVVSTTSDLITWNKALHSGKVLSDSSYKQMTQGYHEIPGNIGAKTTMGYGIFISELENGEKVYHHPGSALAIRSESGCIPEKQVCFAVLSNVMNHIPKEIMDQIDMENPANQLDIIYFTKHVLKSL